WGQQSSVCAPRGNTPTASRASKGRTLRAEPGIVPTPPARDEVRAVRVVRLFSGRVRPFRRRAPARPVERGLYTEVARAEIRNLKHETRRWETPCFGFFFRISDFGLLAGFGPVAGADGLVLGAGILARRARAGQRARGAVGLVLPAELIGQGADEVAEEGAARLGDEVFDAGAQGLGV